MKLGRVFRFSLGALTLAIGVAVGLFFYFLLTLESDFRIDYDGPVSGHFVGGGDSEGGGRYMCTTASAASRHTRLELRSGETNSQSFVVVELPYDVVPGRYPLAEDGPRPRGEVVDIWLRIRHNEVRYNYDSGQMTGGWLDVLAVPSATNREHIAGKFEADFDDPELGAMHVTGEFDFYADAAERARCE